MLLLVPLKKNSQYYLDLLGQNDVLALIEPIDGKFMLNRIIGEGDVID